MYWDRLWLTFVSHSCIDRGLYDVCTSCPSLSTRLRLWRLLTPGIRRRVPWQMYGPREPAAFVVKVNRGNLHTDTPRNPEVSFTNLGLFCHGTNDADFTLPGAYTPLDFWDTLFYVFHNQATKPTSTCLHSDWSPFLRIWEPDTPPCNTSQ